MTLNMKGFYLSKCLESDGEELVSLKKSLDRNARLLSVKREGKIEWNHPSQVKCCLRKVNLKLAKKYFSS